MTPDDTLIELLDRVAALQGAPALIDAHELAHWSSNAVAAMKAQKLIIKARHSASAICPGCEEDCVMPVHAMPAPSGNPEPFIVCDKRDDVSRVPVPASYLKQWQASGDSIADLLAGLLGLQRSGIGNSSAGRWEIGVFRGNKHSSHLVMLAHDKLTLTLGGHTITLPEALTFDGGTFKVDRAILSSLVDQPVAAAGDKESAAQRRERLKKRVKELKARGVKAFLKTTAEEEGISVPRLKQLLK